jgi:hypothetical protein
MDAKTPSSMTTTELLRAAATILRADAPDVADEVGLRADRIDQMQYQAAPGHNDLTGQTPDQVLATVNAPSPE